MPRLAWPLIKKAYSENSLLPLLLRPCRDLVSARNELRWLREHAVKRASKESSLGRRKKWRTYLRHDCSLRSHGRPLQYILGNSPFGGLDIICKPNVLIPRPETEAYTTHLANLLISSRGQKRGSGATVSLLDLCSGSGCISLLFHSLLRHHYHNVYCTGVDISPDAIRLASKNVRHNVRSQTLCPEALEEVTFTEADLLSTDGRAGKDNDLWTFLAQAGKPHARRTEIDVVISNPPYISANAYSTTTSRSVRNWEPRFALLPQPNQQTPHDDDIRRLSLTGDLFYPRIFSIARAVRARVVVTEVSDMAQAERVALLARTFQAWDHVEIWRDAPDTGLLEERGNVDSKFNVRGSGEGRSVVCWTLKDNLARRAKEMPDKIRRQT